jgi:hypothetical protein
MKRLQKIEYAAAVAGMAGILPASAITSLKHDQICLANETRFNESYFNEPLTTYAVGWRDPNNIEQTLEFFAPAVPVSRRFTYKEHKNAEEFLSDTDDTRAIGAEFKRVEFTGAETEAKTDNKGLTIRVDMDQVKETPNWRELYTGRLIRRCYRSELRRAITLLSAAATNVAKTWDTTAGKDPDNDVQADLVTGSTARGIMSNRIGYGETAWVKRALAHRAQNTAGGMSSAGMTAQQVAGLLGVDQVLVSRERYQTSATAKAEIVSNLVLMFYAVAGALAEDPANIKRFISPVEGGGYLRVYEQQMTAKLIDITVEYYSLIKITSTLGIRKFTVS